MIEIKFTQVESMEPRTLRNIGGMFEVLAQYAEKLTAEMNQQRVPAPVIPSPVVPPPVAQADAKEVFAQPPATPPAPPAAPAPGIDVDAKGLPWDGRIHSSSKAKVADGTWRQRRNLEPGLLEKVEAELRQAMAAPAPAAPVAPAPPFAVGAEPSVPTPPNSTPAVPTPQVPSPVGAVPAASPNNGGFLALMKGITAGYAAKTITQEMINEAVSSVGLPSLPMLATRPELVASVATKLGVAI